MGFVSQMQRTYAENNALVKNHRDTYKEYLKGGRNKKTVYKYKEATKHELELIRKNTIKEAGKGRVIGAIVLLLAVGVVGVLMYGVLL